MPAGPGLLGAVTDMIAGAWRLAARLVPLLAALPSGRAHAQQLRDLFRAVSPSVVVVRTVETAIAPTGPAVAVRAPGLGSGVLIGADGRVLTAAHVVQTADRVTVEFADGTQVPARVVTSQPRADLALLQLDRVPPGIVPAPIGDSDRLEVGDQVVVIGAPYGLSRSLTVGHVSGRVSPPGTVGGMQLELIQTDAAINAGNSGGPMLNLAGEVVGIVTHIYTQSGGFEGLGFAVSSKLARALVLSGPSFWSGVDGTLLTDDLARIFNLPQAAGLLVERVAEGSPGAELGLRAGRWRATIERQELLVGGDVILSVAGVVISADGSAFDRMRTAIGAMRPGDAVVVRVLRGGQVVALSIRVKGR